MKTSIELIEFTISTPFKGWEWNATRGSLSRVEDGHVAVDLEFRAVCPERVAVHGAIGLIQGKGRSLRTARAAAKAAARKWVQQSCAYFD